MTEYRESDFVREIAEELIEKLPDFREIREAEPVIYYQESNKRSRGARIIFGDCTKATDKMRAVVKCDYVITINMPNCEGFTMNQMRLLIYHELLHIDCKRDEDGNLTRRIRPHNLEDFHEVVDRFGTWWEADSSVGDILEDCE